MHSQICQPGQERADCKGKRARINDQLFPGQHRVYLFKEIPAGEGKDV